METSQIESCKRGKKLIAMSGVSVAPLNQYFVLNLLYIEGQNLVIFLSLFHQD